MLRRRRFLGVQFQHSRMEVGSSSAQHAEANTSAHDIHAGPSSPSTHHSTAGPSSSGHHDPSVDLADDELHIQDGSGRVTRCGPIVVRDVWQMPNGERIVIECNELGWPIKKAASLLSSFLGIVARRHQLCPLSYAKWNDMLPMYKVEILRVVQGKFVLPPSS